jgi:UDP-3-O-[3-hydroxymyristoyl] glucosamine N-acyltransferase
MGLQLKIILEKFPELLKLESGDSDAYVDRLQTPSLATARDMIFISDAKHLSEAMSGHSEFWVIQSKFANDLPKPSSKQIIVSANPYLAMALIGKEFFPLKPGTTPVDGLAVHPSAVISKSAVLGKNVHVGPGAVISDNCQIGDDAVIGSNTVLEPQVKIGANTFLHPTVFVGHSCEIGDYCEIKPNTTIGGDGFGYAHDQKGQYFPITHYGRVVIENRVSLGSGVTIDRGTYDDSVIGEGTKIDNLCHFGHNIQIGKNTIIVGGALVAGSVTIGSHCVFGGRVTIAGHLKICDQVQLMGISMVTKSIEQPGQYGGFPLQPASDVLKSRAILPLLPLMRKQLLRLLKKLDMEE